MNWPCGPGPRHRTGIQPWARGSQELLRDLVAIDGSLLPALPRMVWALWQDDQHRAAKMHLAFAALRQVPVGVTVTAGNGSERAQARAVSAARGVLCL